MFRKLILAVLFVFVCQVSSCAGGNTPEEASTSKPVRAEESDFLALMPENTQFIMYANLEEMKNSKIGEDFRDEFEKKWREEEERDYEEFVRETGLNLKRDIVEAWLGGYSVEDNDAVAGLIVRGRFNEERIVDYLKKKEKHDYLETEYKGQKVYRFGDDDGHLTFLDKNSLVLGDEIWLLSVIDHKQDKGRSLLDNRLMLDHIATLGRKDHLWGVLDLSDWSDDWAQDLRKNSPFQGTESIEKMKSIVFYSYFADKTDVYIRGDFTTSEEAETVADLFNGVKAMAKLMVSDDREAVDMLNDIRIGTNGSVVEVKTKLDKTFWEKVQEKRGKFSDKPIKML